MLALYSTYNILSNESTRINRENVFVMNFIILIGGDILFLF